MATNIGRALAAAFRAPVARKPDTQRKAREEAKTLAAAHGIEIERLRDGGFNVWPPKGFEGEDPNGSDHYANDWDEVLPLVRAYVPA